MFDSFVIYGLWNLAAATLLAMVAWVLGIFVVRPAWRYGSWLLAMLKLITPPLVVIPILTLGVDRTERRHDPIEPDELRQPPHEILFAAGPEILRGEPLEFLPDLPEHFPERKQRPDEPKPAAPPSAGNPHRFDPVAPPASGPERTERAAVDGGEPARLPRAKVQIPSRSRAVFVLPSLPDVLGLLGILWLATSLGWLLLSLWRTWRFWQALGPAQVAGERWQAEARSMAERLGLCRAPAVWLVDASVSPMLWLFPTIRLVLPRQLMSRLDWDQRRALLLHELAHFGRGDHWVRLCELLALALYWWCPVAWWIRRRLREAEEECCDAWVIEVSPQQARAYATAIVETLEYLSRPRPALPMVASGLGEVRFFQRRLKMIMSGKAPRKLSRLGLLAMVGAGAMVLPLLPGIAQTQGERREGEREARERQERREGEREARERQERREGKEREREGRDGERRERERAGEGGDRREKIEQLHRRLREIHEQFEMQRRKFERATQEIHEALRRLGAEPPLPPEPPWGGEGRAGPPHGPEPHIFELERRMRRLEEMVERLMIQIERRGFGPPRDFRDRPRDREGGPPRPPFGRDRDFRPPPLGEGATVPPRPREGGDRRPRPDRDPPRPPQPPRPDRPERPEA